MCWIFAYSWEKDVVPLLLEWLQSLEYRGYDSAGLIAINSNKDTFLEKALWKVSMLARAVEESRNQNIHYNIWIAHTRWATHGEVTIENTHPHSSSNSQFYVVHNGIIENYLDLKNYLNKKGYNFYGDTDSEVLAKLIEEYYNWNMLETLELVCSKIIWAYSVAVINTQNPEELYWIKLGSPMILWITNEGVILSSDINTVSKYATDFISLDDREIVKIEKKSYKIFSLKEKTYIKKEIEKVDDDFCVAYKGDFETFTQKEIHEIPDVLRNVTKGRIDFEKKSITSETLEQLSESGYKKIEIIASWSSYFAGQVGASWCKSLAGIDAEVRVSSEFLYDTFIPQDDVLYIFMSQSWETADVRESVRKVQEKWCNTFWIVNTVWSTIARMCDSWMYTHAWMEVGVASTKNVIAQLAVLLMITISIGTKRNLQGARSREIIEEFGKLPDVIERQLQNQQEIEKLVEKYSKFENFFFLWRWLLQWTAQEASLKVKELSYIHSEAYATWELKHGPLALVWPNFPCFIMWATQSLYEKTVSNVKEIAARKAPVVWIVYENSKHQEIYNDTILLESSDEVLAPFVSLIPMWLFAVWVAKKLGRDIDKPQNLAKSVTVE